MGYLALQWRFRNWNSVDCIDDDHCAVANTEAKSSNLLADGFPGPYPEHSRITCLMDDSDSEFDRRCHLQNVCWDRRESTFVHYLDPDRSGGGPGKIRRISVRRYRPFNNEYLPLVERLGPIPLTNATFPDQKVFTYFTSVWAENFGHALVDDIHPLFALMYAFRMTTRDSVFLYPREIGDNFGVGDIYGGDRERASRFLHQLAGLISDHGIVRMDTHSDFSSVLSNHSGSHLTCLRHLLVGSGNLENLNYRPDVNIIGSWQEFIKEILEGWRRELGIGTEESFPPPTKAHLLVFLRKRGRRRFLNLDMIVEEAKKRFSEVETILIDPAEMTLVEQISMAQRATVTFSPCGGTSFFNAFLRDGTTAIIADYWDKARNRSTSMEGYFWDRVTSHQTMRYKVEKSEITIIEPPEGRKDWEDGYRDHGATMLDVDRAMHLIDQALYTAVHMFGF
jgi:hypothetical protein